MKNLSRIFKSENFFALLVLLVGLSLSLSPMFYELLRRNDIFPDRQFVLVYNFAPDYNAYLSKIIQGIQGRWSVVEYFTSEVHRGSLLQIFYLSMGKIGGLFSSNPEFSYHLGRILFGAGWIWIGWLFIKFSFVSRFYRKIALLFFVFGGNLPRLVDDQTGYGFLFLGKKWEQTLVGWSNLDPVRRMTFIPHWNVGHVMGTLALLFFIKHLGQHHAPGVSARVHSGSVLSQVSRNKNLLISIILGLATGFTLPSMLVGIYSILGLFFLYKTFNLFISVFCHREESRLAGRRGDLFDRLPRFSQVRLGFARNDYSWLISLAIFVIITFISLTYNLRITGFYPWKALVETDLYVNRTPFPYLNYLLALGPVGMLGILGVFLAFLLKKEKLYWSSFWVLGMFILILVFDKIRWHNQTRFLEVGPELPLSILAVLALSVTGTVFGKAKTWFVLICSVVILATAGFLFAISIKAQTAFIDHKILGSYPPLSLGNFVVYPVKTAMEGVNFIARKAQDQEVTLSGYITGNHIGAYAGKFVYVGHGSQTVHFYEEKQPRVIEFYQGIMTQEDAQQFLRENRIKYVFFGPEEKTYGDYPTRVDFLEKVFESRDVVIYQVNF